jgi:hypothetical protein
MLHLLAPECPAGVQEAAARGFGNLVCGELSPEARPLAYQAIPLLVRLAKEAGAEGARQAATRAMSNLACCDEGAKVRSARRGGCFPFPCPPPPPPPCPPLACALTCARLAAPALAPLPRPFTPGRDSGATAVPCAQRTLPMRVLSE